jgi:hypothetical protein
VMSRADGEKSKMHLRLFVGHTLVGHVRSP